MNLLLVLGLIGTVYSSTYTLVKSDLVTGTHTWVDSSGNALSALASTTGCILTQSYLTSTSSSAQTISNTYTLTTGQSYEIYIKVIFSGTWTNEAFTIYKDNTGTVLKTQSLTSTSFSTTFCQLTSVNVILFKVSISSLSSTSLKLILGYPAASSGSNTKTIQVGPVLIYRVDPDVAASTSYVANDQFNYFKDSTQNPTAFMSFFAVTSGSGLNFDLMSVGTGTVNFMLGGYGIWKQGTITYTKPLSAHYSVKFSFYVYLFDSTTTLTQSNLVITLNGPTGTVTLGTDTMKLLQSGNLYGGTAKESIYYISTEQDHTNSNLIITIQNTLTSYMGITKLVVVANYCIENCSSCKSQGTCDSCASTTNRDLVTCLCLPSYYENPTTHSCVACDYRCASCSYDSANPSNTLGVCSECKYGFDINNACTTCMYTYQFENTPAITCDNCAPCCKTCKGPTDKDCILFQPGYYIMPDNQAVLACPSNYLIYVQSSIRSLCIQCDNSCKTCVDQSTKCTSCYTGYTLLFNQCLLDCPTSTYRAGLVCTACTDPNCFTCTATQCLLCKPNNFMQRISQTCQSTCESGYYGDTTTLTCGKCHQTCIECVGPSFTQCSSCSGTNFMLPIDTVNVTGMCFKTCKEGYFPENKMCKLCYEGCQFCTSFSVCQACVAGFYLNGSTCVSSCPSGMYPNDTVQKCYKCNSACQECFGAENYQCYSCTGGLSQYQGKCYTDCPVTTVSISGICTSCTLGCDVCVGTAINDCTTCSAQKYILNGQCHDECPANYEPNITTMTCEFCVTEHCETCVSDLCKLCQKTYYYYQLMCQQSCPSITYKSEDDRKCKPCDTTCLTCSGPDIDNCLTCPSTYYFYYNNCLPACPDGYFSDASNICWECDLTCQTCTGASANSCTSCLDSYLLNGACLVTCPAHYYPSDFYQTCQPCHLSCLTCQGPTENECLTCPIYIQRMKCVNACGVDFNLVGVECVAKYPITLTCEPQCATCSLVASNCNTCYTSRMQNKPQCSCVKGTFEVGKADCAACLNKCATCSGTADACLTCKGNRFGSSCQCPDYYYEDLVSTNCPKCGYKCSLCTKAAASTDNVCTTCSDIRINPPACGCPDGYFDNLETTCVACEPICATCQNVASQCITCASIRINPPFCTCPTKFFDFQNACLACPFECDNCDSSGCVTCNGNQSGPYSGKCICLNGYSRKSIGSVYCTNCDMGVPRSIMQRGLSKITVDFGGPLVLIDTTKTGCDQVFSATTFAALGKNPTCDVSDIITVTLGSQATINIGDSITFGTGFMLKGCTATFNHYQPSLLLMDSGLTDEDNLPYIQFGGLSPKSICEPVPIKFAVGNTGSRNLQQFQWALTLPQNYVNQVLNQLLTGMSPTNTFDTTLTIPKLILSPFTFYQITVTYTNFLNLQTSSLLYVQSLGSASVDILEPDTSNTYHRYEQAIVNATFTYYNCTLVGAMVDTIEVAIKYGDVVIAQYSEEISLMISTSYTISQIVEPYVFAIGSNSVSISASIPAQSLSYTTTVDQEISIGSLVVKVAGGNRQVGDVAIVTLTASVTDLDVGPKETDDFHYVFTWTCLDVLLGADCKDPYGKLLTYKPGPSITVSASDLSQYNSYVFTATTKKLTKEAHGKSMIQVIEIDLPQLQPANQTVEDLTLAQTYNYYDEVPLSFLYEAANPDNLLYSATVIYDLEVKKSFKFYSLTFKFRILDYFTDFTTTQGNQVSLRVSVYNPTYVMPSLRTLAFTYNIPPTSCEIILNNNSTIYEFSTTVNVTIASCQDDDTPLSYKVLFYNNQTVYDNDKSTGRFLNNFVALDYQNDNQLLFTVPFVGDPIQNNYTSLLVFLIKDNGGGIVNMTYPITINQDPSIDQTKLSKLIDHQDDISSSIATQDMIVNRLNKQTNCSELKYEILRRNDFLVGNDLPVDQQNALLNQMTILTADDEVNHQFKFDLGFLYNFNQSQELVYQQLKALVDSESDTLKQQEYIHNYFRYFDLFTNLIQNGVYYNTTNTETLANVEVIKDHLIDFTIVNGDGYTLNNSNSKLVIKKASQTILNQLTGNILQEEILFRLLTTTETTNYEYYYQIFDTTNPYLYESTFPTNYSIGAAVVYLRVIDQGTQEDATMLQPFSYTFRVDEVYGTNKTICIQRLYENWTSSGVETTLVNSTAITCKISVYNPFTIVYNSTVDKNTTTTNSTTSNSTNSTNSTNTNTNNTSTSNSTNSNTNSTTSNNNTNTNSTQSVSEISDSGSVLLQPFYIYLIVLGSLVFILAFLAHFKDQQFAKVAQSKKTNVDIMFTENKRDDNTPVEKKLDNDYLKQRAFDPPSIVFKNSSISHCNKLKLIILNFHQLISIFYRTQGYRKSTYFVYLIRLLLIQTSIFIIYIYRTFHYELILVYISSHFVFSMFSFFLNYPYQKTVLTIIKIFTVLISLGAIGLGIYRIILFIQEDNKLDEITYLLVSQIVFDNLIYNFTVLMFLYFFLMREGKIAEYILQLMPKEDKELIADNEDNQFNNRE